ncbi:MAG: DNA-binding protein [Hydrogenophilales bacterium RIFOXYD1_FULL_62_11]|nr:MAG: DNA-binding protein [Hydrogenophilales bacterium RIFOXYD1_FULL_62_11]
MSKAASTKRIKPITEKMTKSALQAHLADVTGLAKRDVASVLTALDDTIKASIHKKGVGEFTLPGVVKFKTERVPAKPKRKGINPFTKEETMFAAKPATTKIKVRAMKSLKDAAL